MNGADRPESGPQRFAAGAPGTFGSGGDDAQGSAAGGPASPPIISLPKGGGAIRRMGEKFSANPVTGTGSLSVPVYTSPGRSGFNPQLSLSYDSGAGNGPFGFGWTLSLPSIARKTDKGLPQYRDGVENQPDSDIFVLSGAEDLVPVLKKDDQGNWWTRPSPVILADTGAGQKEETMQSYQSSNSFSIHDELLRDAGDLDRIFRVNPHS